LFWQRKSKKELEGSDWKKVGNFKLSVRNNRLGEEMQEDQFINVVFDGNKMNVYEAPEQPKDEEINL
jgi:hypothetical protein